MAPRLAFIHALNGQYPCHTPPLQTQKYERRNKPKEQYHYVLYLYIIYIRNGTQLNRQVSYSHNVGVDDMLCVADSRHKDLQRVHQQQNAVPYNNNAARPATYAFLHLYAVDFLKYISHRIAHSVATRRVVHCMHDFALYYFMRSYSECLCTFTQFLSCF